MSDNTSASDLAEEFDKAIEALLKEIALVENHYKEILEKYREEPDKNQRAELRKKLKQLDDEISRETLTSQEATTIKRQRGPNLNPEP